MKRAFLGAENSGTGSKRSESLEQIVDVDGDEDQDDHNESVEPGPSKKKKRTSPMWNHFSIQFVQEQNAEFAYCKHCTKYTFQYYDHPPSIKSEFLIDLSG